MNQSPDLSSRLQEAIHLARQVQTDAGLSPSRRGEPMCSPPSPPWEICVGWVARCRDQGRHMGLPLRGLIGEMGDVDARAIAIP